MNYLAHFYLSDNNEGLIIGNYIADEIRGKAYLKYPEEIQQGIIIHRKIDDFTDKHPIVFQSKDRIRKIHRKYTPVIVDVYYDYLLANNWSKHSNENLKNFTAAIYKTLFKNIIHIPIKSQLKLGFMSKGNWLYNYKEIEGIERALKGLSRRTKYENSMFRAHVELEKMYIDFENDFNQFFPELKDFVETEIKKGI